MAAGTPMNINPDYPLPPALTYFASVTVQVGEAISIGITIDGERRVIPIIGGTVAGNGFTGKVLDAGADFQLYPQGTAAYLKAMYVIETDDGTRLFVDNAALRTGSAEDLANLASGEAVPAERIYFRFTPRITAPADSAFAWVNHKVFVGTGQRLPESVLLEFFCVD